MAFPKNCEELSRILKMSALLDCKPAILGAGTNVLAPDEGVQGLVICLKDCLDGIECLDENRIRVAAGVTMARAAVFAANAGLSGMEFAHGIPGTIGGGVYMNAGAYGGDAVTFLKLVPTFCLMLKRSIYVTSFRCLVFLYFDNFRCEVRTPVRVGCILPRKHRLEYRLSKERLSSNKILHCPTHSVMCWRPQRE